MGADPANDARSIDHVRSLDGMRAVAVILVLLFHFRVAGFGSGFLGVDIFFVLSGFLITTLLIAEVARTGRVSLPDFWARRARRLLPALVLLMVTVAVVTGIGASYTERHAIRSDLLATTAYIANWHFVAANSYFNDTGIASPLQHMWSLAIEEQFYLLWPLVVGLVVIRVAPRRAVSLLAGLGILASALLLAVLWSPDAPDRAYMGTDARMFEPLVGALGAAIVAAPSARKHVDRFATCLVALGVVGLVACLIVIDPAGRNYYAGGALVLSVSTLLILMPLWLGHARPMGRVLSWTPIAWIGVVSYGLYLWHWPIALWLDVRDASGAGLLVRQALAAVATFGVAGASYYLIERPIRRGRQKGQRRTRSARRRTLIAVPIALGSVACVSLAATRVPPASPADRVVMLVGDSVPLKLEVPIEDALSSIGWRLVSGAHGGCPVTGEAAIIPGGTIIPFSAECPDAAIPAMQDAVIRDSDPDVVVWWDRMSIAGFVTADGQTIEGGTPQWWRARRTTLDEAAQRLHARGATIVFVATEPPGQAIGTRRLPSVAAWVDYQVEHYGDITTRWDGMLRTFARRHKSWAAYIDISLAVCKVEVAPCDDTVEGAPARRDGTHYVGPGATAIVAELLRQLTPVLAHIS